MPSDSDQLPTPQTVESINQPAVPNGNKRVDHIAHVLFLDIVGFTKLLPENQIIVLDKLQEIVRTTEEFCTAKNTEQLIALPTGDGMALVFLNTVGVLGPAICCAEKIAEAIINYNKSTTEEANKIKVRMGIHSGSVVLVDDINGNRNVAGDGINTAQRVMDCGDIGHILLSDKAVHFLPGDYDRTSLCDDYPNVKVKHDESVHLSNLCKGVIGNKERPTKIRLQQQKTIEKYKRKAENIEEAEKQAAQARIQEEEKRKVLDQIKKAEKRRRRRLWALAIFGILAISASAIFFWPRAQQPRDALAVLPFKAISEKKSSKVISQGLTDQLIRSFHYLTGRKPVITGRNTPISTLEAGKQLGVRYVLTGTAESHNNDVNLVEIAVRGAVANPDFLVDVHVELYDTETNKRIWAIDKSTAFIELFALQKTIVEEVSTKMGVQMQNIEFLNQQYAQKSKAFSYYLWGRFWSAERPNYEGNKEVEEVVIQKAIWNYNQASETDPSYALAHVGLADLHLSIGGSSEPPQKAKEEALRHAEDALKREENLPEAYASIGTEKFFFERDFISAKLAFLKAIELDPISANNYKRYSSCLAAFGKEAEAEQQIKEAIAREPDSALLHVTHGQNYFFARKYDMAIEQLQEAIRLQKVTSNKPLPVAHRFLALALEQKGQYNEALNHLEAAEGPCKSAIDADVLGSCGHILARMNNIDEALGIAQRLVEMKKGNKYVSAFNIALIYAEIPNMEIRAFQWLGKAIEESDTRVAWLKVDPRFDTLRQANKPEFYRQLRKANFSV